MSFTSRSGAAFEDLTARARIRDAALEHFAECGFDRATIRGIARTAGVSPGLVRHHFGSKDDLRNACDAYALEALRGYVDQAMTDEGLNDPQTLGQAWTPLYPFRQYLARTLIDGSEAAGRIFDELVAMTEQGLRQTDKHRPDPPVADLRTRAALMVAMTLGIPAFGGHISRSIGVEIFSAEGDRRISQALLDIHSHPVISPDSARTLRQGLGKPGA
jgi:AcrR family transcriptional regulator